MIELGDKVKDRITGLVGIATGVTKWLYGCTRFAIQPQEIKDGKPAELWWVDEPQVEVLEAGVVKPLQPSAVGVNHGPRPTPQRQPDPVR